MSVLGADFFAGSDVVGISRRLLGKHLFTRLPLLPGREGDRVARTVLTGGIIVETEAYAGVTDRASHAYGNRRTGRTATMYRRGGVAYVYLCYGLHAMLNMVTNVEDVPHAILIRAIEPTHGIAAMLKRRGLARLDRRLTGGPGMLTEALGIDVSYDGADLEGRLIWLEDRTNGAAAPDMVAAPRVGVAYAGADARLPWRFMIRDNPWVSRG